MVYQSPKEEPSFQVRLESIKVVAQVLVMSSIKRRFYEPQLSLKTLTHSRQSIRA